MELDRVAVEKWCIVVATAREGEREPIARWTLIAADGEAP
jgi:hypothetical protein